MLPQLFAIEIHPSKLQGYLLNPDHADGKSKEKFFRLHGIMDTAALEALLRTLIRQNNIGEIIRTEFGTKYIVDGQLSGTDNSILRTVWIILNGENVCRFVTAYPL